MTELDVGFAEEDRVALEVGRLFLSAHRAADRILSDARSAAEGLRAEADRQARGSAPPAVPGNAKVANVEDIGPAGPRSGDALAAGRALVTELEEIEVQLERSRTALLSRIAELGEQGRPDPVVPEEQSSALGPLSGDEGMAEAAAPPSVAATSPFVDQAFRRDRTGLDAVLFYRSSIAHAAGAPDADHPPVPTAPPPPDDGSAEAAPATQVDTSPVEPPVPGKRAETTEHAESAARPPGAGEHLIPLRRTQTDGLSPPAAVPVGSAAVRSKTGRPAWIANVIVAMLVVLGLAGVLALTNV